MRMEIVFQVRIWVEEKPGPEIWIPHYGDCKVTEPSLRCTVAIYGQAVWDVSWSLTLYGAHNDLTVEALEPMARQMWDMVTKQLLEHSVIVVTEFERSETEGELLWGGQVETNLNDRLLTEDGRFAETLNEWSKRQSDERIARGDVPRRRRRAT